jgi:hypothetical protein
MNELNQPLAQDTSEDSALLPFESGVLYNNVFAKGNIQNAYQQIFLAGGQFGWEWDWPENAGAHIKSYPEVIQGRSPWCKTDYSVNLPCTLEASHFTLDFDFASDGDGSWADSFDFWITGSPRPGVSDITCNLCIWLQTHDIQGNYVGKHQELVIGGHPYHTIIETPADQPAKTWNTLFVLCPRPVNKGVLDLRPFLEKILEFGLARPEHFLATAELGSEVVYGKGKTAVNQFRVR